MPFIRQKAPTPYQEKHSHITIVSDVLKFLGNIREKAAHCDTAKYVIAFGSGAQMVIRQTRWSFPWLHCPMKITPCKLEPLAAIYSAHIWFLGFRELLEILFMEATLCRGDIWVLVRSFKDLERSATLGHTYTRFLRFLVDSLIKSPSSQMLVFRDLPDPRFFSPLSPWTDARTAFWSILVCHPPRTPLRTEAIPRFVSF